MRSIQNACRKEDALGGFLLSGAKKLLRRYLHSQQDRSGAFVGPDHRPDLYYTMFGLACLTMLKAKLPGPDCLNPLETDPNQLDAVHLHCLLRCRILLGQIELAAAMLPQVEKFRSRDGAYSRLMMADHGDAYATFMSVRAYCRLDQSPPEPHAIADGLDTMKLADGSYCNDLLVSCGTATGTAAALCALAELGMAVPGLSIDWLQHHFVNTGGVRLSASTPGADLLSTATVLEALDTCRQPAPAALLKPTMDFVEDRWQVNGGFAATPDTSDTDVEYTFYGLLALHCLFRAITESGGMADA